MNKGLKEELQYYKIIVIIVASWVKVKKDSNCLNDNVFVFNSTFLSVKFEFMFYCISKKCLWQTNTVKTIK